MKLIFPRYIFKKIEGQPEVKEKPAETTYNLIFMLTNDKYPQGIDGTYRRIFGRIDNKLNEAIESDAKYVDLEQAEIDLIRNVLKEAKVKVGFVPFVILLEDAVEEIEKEPKVKK